MCFIETFILANILTISLSLGHNDLDNNIYHYN